MFPVYFWNFCMYMFVRVFVCVRVRRCRWRRTWRRWCARRRRRRRGAPRAAPRAQSSSATPTATPTRAPRRTTRTRSAPSASPSSKSTPTAGTCYLTLLLPNNPIECLSLFSNLTYAIFILTK